MRGSMKGKQLQVSLYLPPEQYWLLRATSKRTGFSMQYLLRRALDEVLRDARRYPLEAKDDSRPVRPVRPVRSVRSVR